MTKEELLNNYNQVQERVISFAPDPDRVNIIAVSKAKSTEEIETLYVAGQRDFGENYIQELELKAKELKEKGITDIRWHFLGKLQTNKIKALLSYVHQIHTVDSVRVATILSKKLSSKSSEDLLEIFLQVNLDDEEFKGGFHPEQLSEAIKEIEQLENLIVIGFMCIPKVGNVDAFHALNTLAEGYFDKSTVRLSMGMSADFEEALKAGATDVRIGTALFGARD